MDKNDFYTWFILLIIPVAITFNIWLYFFAPCSAIGWMPNREIPGRCLIIRQMKVPTLF